ncbi:MAG: hypothetical protein ACYCO3_15445 [Mycobacteriales bacterium]
MSVTLAEVEAAVATEEVSPDEGRQVLDDAARRWLGISGEEFLAAWRDGRYAEAEDQPEIAKVALLIPFAV